MRTLEEHDAPHGWLASPQGSISYLYTSIKELVHIGIDMKELVLTACTWTKLLGEPAFTLREGLCQSCSEYQCIKIRSHKYIPYWGMWNGWRSWVHCETYHGFHKPGRIFPSRCLTAFEDSWENWRSDAMEEFRNDWWPFMSNNNLDIVMKMYARGWQWS